MARSRGRDAHPRGATCRGALRAIATVALTATPVLAQNPFAGFDDASLPEAWEGRLRIRTLFEGTVDQFGGIAGTGDGRTPLGARFTIDSLNAARLPVVARTQRLLQDSLGVASSLGLTLGTVNTGVRQLVMRVPFEFDLGITRRIALGVTVPYVRTRAAVNFRVNPGGTTGNVGFNPAIASLGAGGAATAAQQQNLRAQQHLDSAATNFERFIAECPTTAGASVPEGCGPIISNRAGALALVRQTRTIANGLAQVYGGGTTARPGALLVPIQGTDAQLAVNARIAALAAQYDEFERADLTTLVLPAAATARIANTGLQRVLSDADFGVFADSLRSTEQAGLGDVELGGSVMWLDTFGPRPQRQAAGVRVRSTVGAAYRLATGAADVAYIWYDVPTGAGSPALLLRSATDVAFGRRLAASLVARVESPIARSVVARIPVFPGELLAIADREQLVDRKLGRQVQVELTPRWAPNDAFAVAAHYALRTKQDDRYSGVFTAADTIGGGPTLSYDASILGTGTGGRAQTYGFGFSYSSLAAFARGHAWAPVEVSYTHSAVVTGSGGVVPRVRSDQLAIRVYAQIRGRSARRAAPDTPR